MNTFLKCFVAGTAVLAGLLILGGFWMIADHGLEPTDDDTIVTQTYTFLGDSITVDFRKGDIDGYPQGHIRFLAPEMVCNSYITPNDPSIQKLWSQLSSKLEGMGDLGKANALLRFVQRNIGYLVDDIGYGHRDYSAYPAETLFYKEGDCEDMSYLLYTLYDLAGLDAVLIHSDSHVSVGVNVDLEKGYYISTLFSSARYYIAESTCKQSVGECDMIGDLPRAFKPIPFFGYFIIAVGLILSALALSLTHSIHTKDRARRSPDRRKEVRDDAEGM